jgi:hypothetical protein
MRLVSFGPAVWCSYPKRPFNTCCGVPRKRHFAAALSSWQARRARYGYRRIHVLLRREGILVNRKRVHRLLYLLGRVAAAGQASMAACQCGHAAISGNGFAYKYASVSNPAGANIR